MKKLLLVLAFISFGLISNAQSESNLVTYEITATGYSNGLPIDTFYVTVMEYDLVQIDGNYVYASYIQTYQDTANVVNLVNDSIAGRTYYPTNKPSQAIFNQTVKQQLNDIYGAQNVKEVN